MIPCPVTYFASSFTVVFTLKCRNSFSMYFVYCFLYVLWCTGIYVCFNMTSNITCIFKFLHLQWFFNGFDVIMIYGGMPHKNFILWMFKYHLWNMILLIEEGYIQDINSYSLGERDKSLKFHQKVNQDTLYQLKNSEVNDIICSILAS